MLELSDFRHLPELDRAVEELIADGTGLTLIAGLDAPPAAPSPEGLPLPSGRASLFRILTRRLLSQATRRVLVIAPTRDAIRVGRGHQRRVEVVAVADAEEARARLSALASRPPELVIAQQAATPKVVSAALQLAAQGSKVLMQMNTPCRGLGVVRELASAGLNGEELSGLKWVVASQRISALCASCAALRPVDQLAVAEYRGRFPGYPDLPPELRHAEGCAACGGTGRSGEVFLFDVYGAAERHSSITYERYALSLAMEGSLALDDVLSLEAAQLRQAHGLREASEAALRAANASLQLKVTELESAHRVSTQRTEALLSLQRISEALLSDANPPEMAARLCRQARELCGADRVVLYAVDGEQAVALGEAGWGRERLPAPLPVESVCCQEGDQELRGRAAPFGGWPPGIPKRVADVEGAELRAGLRAPLIAQGVVVGALYVHSTTQASFAPGHVALLQTFAAQAALALQRAALTEELRAKVAALEAAQAGLAVKERMARELELARQVQESFLPKAFPHVAGYAFAAYSEPAREVGGDFYDVIDLGEGRIGLVIADVSDKGMAAALYMALSRSLIRAEAVRERSPRVALSNVNRSLLDLGEQAMFVTVFYAVLDTRGGELVYARAGHDRPLLLRDGTAIALGGAGALLGLFDDAPAVGQDEVIWLMPGDRLALYTDGLTDVMNTADEMLGLERLTELLLRHADLPADAFSAGVADALARHRGEAEQADDMTLLVVAIQ